MLLHVLLKTRIHFYLCKYKSLQFGHESSAPVSFKYAFMIARRLVLLPQPWYLGESLLRGLSQAPWSPGRRLHSVLWFPLLEPRRAMETSLPRRGLQPSLAKPCSLLSVGRARRLPSPAEAVVPRIPGRGAARRGHSWPGRALRR